MAKAQAAVKPKSSIGDWFRRKPKAKPGTRPAGVPSSTVTNITAGPITKTGGASAPTKPAPAAVRKPAKAASAPGALASFRVPFIGAKPVTAQLQILGLVALLLLGGLGF